jgi:O-antigen/teichoic acid export membrane protein
MASSRFAPGDARLRRNSLASLMSFVVPTILMIAATPLLLHRMGATTYGLWMTSVAAFGLLGALEFGLGTALAKFVAEHRSRGDARALSATATVTLLSYLALGAVLTPLLFFAAPHIAPAFASAPGLRDQVTSVLRLVALGLPALLLLAGGTAVAAGLERFEIGMFANCAQSALTLIAAVVVVYTGGSVSLVVFSSLMVLWAVAIACAGYAARVLSGMGARPLVTRQHTRKMLSYVGITSITSLGLTIFGSSDRIAVGAVLGLRAVAYYSVSIAIANKIVTIADVLTRPLLPRASAQMAGGDPAAVARTLVRLTGFIALICLPLAVFLLAVSDPLLTLWVGPSFAAHAVTTFRVLIAIYALVSLAAPSYHTANGAGYPGVNAVTTMIGGVGTIGLIVAFAPFGVVGAAAANAPWLVNLAIPVCVLSRLRAHAFGQSRITPLQPPVSTSSTVTRS